MPLFPSATLSVPLVRQSFSDVANSSVKPGATSVLRWQPHATLSQLCELSSSSELALQRAQQLFALSFPHIVEQTESAPHTSFASTDSIWRWSVEPDILSGEPNSCAENAKSWCACNLESGQIFKGELARVLTYIEYSIVQGLVDCTKRGETPFFAMHAALLCKNDFGLIVVGPSESGESTLSCGLWCNGWQLLSDDFCFLQKAEILKTSSAESLPFFQATPALRRASLREGSRALVGEALWQRLQNAPSSFQTAEGWLFHPHEVEESSAPRVSTVRIGAIVMLGRREAAFSTDATALQLISPARAALALLPYGSLLPRSDDENAPSEDRVLDWGAALPKIAPLVEVTPVYAMKRDTLQEMVQAVDTLRESSAR